MPRNKEFLPDDEAARRRDEVVRRMANTPPQPNVNPLHGRKKTKADADHVVRKDHVRRGD